MSSITFTSEEYVTAVANVHTFLETILSESIENAQCSLGSDKFAETYQYVHLLCTAKPPNNACEALYQWYQEVLKVAALRLTHDKYDKFTIIVALLFQRMDSTYLTRLRLPTAKKVAEQIWESTRMTESMD